MGTHYKNRPEFELVEDLLVEQIIYRAFEIVDKRKPTTTFKKVFKKIIKTRLEVFGELPAHRVYRYYADERFFIILQKVARKMSHGKLVLQEEDMKDVTDVTPIHDFFDILEKLYTAKEELENVKSKSK